MSLSPDQIAWWNSRQFNDANLVSVLFRLICVDGLTDPLVILNATDGLTMAPIVCGPAVRLVDVYPISGWCVLKVALYPHCAIVWVSDPNEGGV